MLVDYYSIFLYAYSSCFNCFADCYSKHVLSFVPVFELMVVLDG
jgi:hypothetical protein